MATRKPVPHYTAEDRLFATLPTALKSELRALLGVRPNAGAFGAVTSLVKSGCSVTAACKTILASYRDWHWNLNTFRAKYDLWINTRDWVSLVNRSKAGADWQDRDDGLPIDFLKFCAARFAQFVRADAKRQALLSIKRQWTTGRNTNGQPEPVPGYGLRSDWLSSRSTLQRSNAPHDFPPGWSYSNICRQIKSRALFTDAVRALSHQGTAAARSFLPQTRFDRNTAGADGGPLRFLECIEFDDVKCDFLIIDSDGGQVCDLWLLIARDRATGILLGFGMRPARTREDGTQEHLRLRDMKQLCGWILERYGLPPYLCIWKIEHGTATLSEGSRAALRELLPDRIDISYSSMIGGASPTGYAQRGIGNSKAKASLESHNRLMHTMAADLPGQTGPLYTVRPMDLAARSREAAETWKTVQQLPEHLRSRAGYPILTIKQSREHLFRIFRLQNERTEHELQGFDDVVECWDESRSLWLPQSQLEFRNPQSAVRTRKESPLERCARLIAPYRDQWTSVSPETITAFYQHTCREVVVKPNGLIQFRTDSGMTDFAPPSHDLSLVPGRQALAYSHPDDPAFIHLTDGHGRVLGTWLRRSRTGDPESVTAAIRYSQSALAAAKTTAADYAAPERERLEQLRASNAELLAANTFVEVSDAVADRQVRSDAPRSTLSSPIAAALTTSKQAVKAAKKQDEEDEDRARAALRKAASMY